MSMLQTFSSSCNGVSCTKQVLMRALRDFNLPKIVSDDNPVFLGLISDLFPSLDVPRKRELEFEKAVKHAACDLKLQPEESFVLKVVQLEELLYVRHSVFVGELLDNIHTLSCQKGLISVYSSWQRWNRQEPSVEDFVQNLSQSEEKTNVQ